MRTVLTMNGKDDHGQQQNQDSSFHYVCKNNRNGNSDPGKD